MRTLVDAIEREDEAAIAGGVIVPDDPAHTFALAYARAMIAGRRYWHAAWSRWGRQEAIKAYVRRGLRLPDSYLESPQAHWDYEGDRAILRHRPGTTAMGAPSPLRQVDGQWLYDPLRRARHREVEAMVARTDATTATYAKLAADIEAGKFASIHEAIDVLFPHQREAPLDAPKLDKRQLDPKTIHGAMMSLGLAYQERDVLVAASFYHVDGPPASAAQLAEAHAKQVLAVNDFTSTVSQQIGGTESLAMEFSLIDPRDDLFGHVITEWTIDGDRATGTNDAGPAAATMRRVDGVWKIDLTPLAGSPPVEQLAAELRRQAQSVAAVARDIREKRLFTVDEVRGALKLRSLVPTTAPAGKGEVGDEG
ncbi:MAG: hypothetical protein WBD40_12730 [Tepidisphaeraceae bacterium]